jgi:GNAT superfamily N-acetyltransferase
VVIREARPGDHATLLDFNTRLAAETESKQLDAATLAEGLSRALADPERLRYWVAELHQGEDAETIGQAAVTREWSDWRNGWIWWLQSVYVRADNRRRGVFRALHAEIRKTALSEGDVIGLRLYVENQNETAQRTYQRLGMRPGGYQVL